MGVRGRLDFINLRWLRLPLLTARDINGVLNAATSATDTTGVFLLFYRVGQGAAKGHTPQTLLVANIPASKIQSNKPANDDDSTDNDLIDLIDLIDKF